MNGTAQETKDRIQELDDVIERVKRAQKTYSTYSQKQVDEIFRAAALAANARRIELAKMAVEETGMGVAEDKVIKNHFASESIYHKYKDTLTVGIIENDEAFGIRKIAEPIGLIAGVVPSTNPTSTTIFKALLALKTRNGIVFSPHPRAKKCTIAAARTVLDAAAAAGAPENIVGWIENPTLELSHRLMTHPSITLILATGGPGMVRAAYSSGKPAVGVGAGNTPAVIDETADIRLAVNSILISKTFDNGVICASEQSVIVVESVYREVKEEFARRGAYFAEGEERRKLAAAIVKDGEIDPAIVGQSPEKIARRAGFEVPDATKLLIAEAEQIGDEEPFSYEKLSPVLALYRAKDFKEATDKAVKLVEFAGMGHTAVLYTDRANDERIESFSKRLCTGRVLINQPSSQGAIGDIYNFRLEPSLTLGCGTWGGNSVSENVGVRHLLNIKTVAERRENMLWFRVPPRIYFKRGCMPVALEDLIGRKKAFIVTDRPLFDLGIPERVANILEGYGLETEVFSDVRPDPDLETVDAGTRRMQQFHPDVIVAVGGGSPMDAAKMMWLKYEHPSVEFKDMALRFMDIRKRVYQFPRLGGKAILVAIPTTSGTGSEVTPFAVVTDNATGRKYPIADYELTPHTAIVDADLVMDMPPALTAYSGIDALTHAIEAMVAVTATDYTNALALESIRILMKYLPRSYEYGPRDELAREKVHNAATIAGMAFANAFLGVCHSMAHKLGALFHLPHGLANALLMTEVIRYNATDAPRKQTAFSQYEYPSAKTRYARIARHLELPGKTEDELVDSLVTAIEKLKAEIRIPLSIKEAGVDEKAFNENLDQLSEMAFDDQCTGANPRFPLFAEIKEIYQRAYRPKALTPEPAGTGV